MYETPPKEWYKQRYAVYWCLFLTTTFYIFLQGKKEGVPGKIFDCLCSSSLILTSVELGFGQPCTCSCPQLGGLVGTSWTKVKASSLKSSSSECSRLICQSEIENRTFLLIWSCESGMPEIRFYDIFGHQKFWGDWVGLKVRDFVLKTLLSQSHTFNDIFWTTSCIILLCSNRSQHQRH